MGTQAPEPVFYLTPGEPVTCMSLKSSQLFIGTGSGNILTYSTSTWKQEAHFNVASSGVLWLDVLDPSPSVSKLTLVTQTRLDGVKMFHQSSDTSTWEKVASFNINHTGFCRGFIELNDSPDGDVVMVAPSEQSSIMVSRLVQHYMRHIVTLAKTGCGTLMSMSPWSTGDGKLLAGYESGHVVLWDWSNNVQLLETNLSDHLGTCMSLTWNVTRSHGVVTGSEDKIVVLDEQLKVVKVRDITNKGVGSVCVRHDDKILICGGWDGRLRLFSWLNPGKLKPLAVLKYHSDTVECIVTGQCQQGRLEGKNIILAGGKDGKISIWEIY